MIDKILRPKSENQILQDIKLNPCPVERFVQEFIFQYKKKPSLNNVSKLIENLQSPIIKITINIRYDSGIEISTLPSYKKSQLDDIEYEIIVEGIECQSFEYKRKIIYIRGFDIYSV